MKRSLGTLFSVAAAALALSACGGGNAGSGSLPAAPQAPSGNVRQVSSTCTPDSYGYCLAYTSSQTIYHQYCYNDQGYIIHTSTQLTNYELYHGSTDDGQYTKSVNTTCSGTDTTWSPEDPSQATGDPNLP